MINVGIFPGSFNPVTLGHIEMATKALESKEIDELWFMLSPHNPWKSKDSLAPFTHRFEMLMKTYVHLTKLFKNKYIFVSDVEQRLPSPNFTYKTLEALKGKPGSQGYNFKLIFGSDLIPTLHKWEGWKSIMEHEILLFMRKGIPFTIPDELQVYGDKFKILGEIENYSATEVRDNILNGKSISKLVIPDVEKYIKENKLYENQRLSVPSESIEEGISQ